MTEITEDAGDETLVDETDETINLTAVDGVLTMQDDIKDYMDRGPQLAFMSFLDFFLNTYEANAKEPSISGRGRKPNERVRYLEGTGHGDKCRVLRTHGHETMPHFIGPWFPRNDVEELQDVYCACMLALFSPWTDMRNLKTADQTFKEAYDEFMKNASEHTKYMTANIQYQHECFDSAARKRAAQRDDRSVIGLTPAESVPQDRETLQENEQALAQVEYNSRDVEHALASEFSHDDKLYVEVALNIAMDCNIFNEDPPDDVEWKQLAAPATDVQLDEFRTLEKLVQAVTKNRVVPNRQESFYHGRMDSDAIGETYGLPAVEHALPNDIDEGDAVPLNEEQQRAHTIISNHLDATLAGRHPKQLLMMVMGPGGTGKTTMLNEITATFGRKHASHLLRKTAMSGVAASLVGGTTLHWFAGIPPQQTPQSDVWPDNSSKAIKDRRTANIQSTSWLAIDEIGICTSDVITLLSQVCGKVRADDSAANSTVPFGGLNVLLTGDFHQFPPVGNANAALYCPALLRNTSIVGKAIYSQFDTVITLVKQERMTDPVWKSLLQRARIGECTKEDIAEVRKLVLTDSKCNKPDFSKLPWSESVLVTHRNAVRATWNRAAVRKHCAQTGNLLYICDADDTVGDSRVPLNMEQKVIVASMKPGDTKKNKGTKKLSHRIEIAIGTHALSLLKTHIDIPNHRNESDGYA